MNNIYLHNKLNRILRINILILIAAFLFISEAKGQLVRISQNADVRMSAGANLIINGSMQIGSGAALTQSGTGDIFITGNWTNGGTFTAGTGKVTFNGNGNGKIEGVSATTFNDLTIDKPAAPTDIVTLEQNITVGDTALINDGIFRFENAAARSLTLNDDLVIAAGGTLDIDPAGVQVHSMSIAGDIVNDGTLDLNGAASQTNTTFTGSANSTVSGTGGTTDFNEIIANKSAQSNTITISSTNFTVPAEFLTLTGGTFHLAGSYTLSTTFFKNYAAEDLIPLIAGLWIDNANVTVAGQSGNLAFTGLLRMSAGTMNIGTGTDGLLRYRTGSECIIDGGTINVNQQFSRRLSGSTINYTQSGGTINVGQGNTINTTMGIFDIGAAGSVFNLSGGTIELGRPNLGATASFNIQASSGTVTGGDLVINSLITGATYNINSTRPVGTFTMQAANNPVADLDADFQVLGDVTLGGIGANRFVADSYNFTIGGDINNNLSASNSFNPGTGTVTLNGSAIQSVQGSQITNFYNFTVNKTGGTTELTQVTRIENNLRFIANALIDMNSNNVTIGENGDVFSDAGSGKSFSNSKMLVNSGGATGAKLIREIYDNPTLPFSVYYPIGTDTLFTPGQVKFLAGGATINSNAEIRILVIPQEHPNVQKTNVSLQRYWQVETGGNVTVNGNGGELTFWYNQSDVRGSEGNYRVLQYNSGNWYMNPGYGNEVNIGFDRILCEQKSSPITGDWTAGEEDAVVAKYYSIADGNYNDPNSWSKVSYGGAVSSTAPGNSADKIYIGDNKTITLTSTPAVSPNQMLVQNTGRLNTQTYIMSSDTFRLEDGAFLGIGSPQGITASGTSGSIQSTSRFFSETATYIYTDNNNQTTGNGIPQIVRALILDKTAVGNTVTLDHSILMRDSLIINQGTLDVTTNLFTVHGETAGRYFTMRGGKIILREDFPTNYSSCTFTGGTVEFNGINGLYIPDGGAANPGVDGSVFQYANLTITGSRGYNYVTFSSLDTTRISGVFDISTLNFANFNTPRFITNGSTISFNGSGNQDIPRDCARNADWARLNYYNLKITGSGTKQLIDRNHLIYNDVLIESATLDANNFDMEVQGDWLNTGGSFTHSNRTVTFNNTSASTTRTITSLDVAFNDVDIDGTGSVQFIDNMTISGNLSILTGGNFMGDNDTLSLAGTWDDNSTFTPGTSTVMFNGTSNQTIDSSPNDTETFYNLIINNSATYVQVFNAGNRNILVQNDLEFQDGNLYARTNNRYVSVAGSVLRTGTGHVDGPLRINIPTGNTSDILFAVGRDNDYVPAILTFNGTDGAAGYLEVEHTNASGGFGGSGLTSSLSIDRRWDISIPGTSSFDIGTRTFNSVIQFLASDVPGGADPLKYQTRRDDGGWNAPSTGTRTSTTTQALGVGGFGRFVVGQPSLLVYYSVADGNWNTPGTWSTAGYGGAAETTDYPSASDSVLIGDGITVTLNIAHTVNSGRAVVVEKAGPSTSSGQLNLGGNIISGAGAFVLKDDGILGVGHSQGITSSGATGNIQTTTRDYNFGTNNNGNFIYNGTAGQVTGNGLPSTMKTFTVDNTGNTVELSNPITTTSDLNITNGTLYVSASNHAITVGGDWINADTFNEASGTVTFNGTADQNINNSNNETFYGLTVNKSAGDVILANNSITVDNTLTFTSGNINGRTNGYPVIIASTGSVSHTSGHVDGEMRRYIPTGNPAAIVYYIGSAAAYTPAQIDVNGTGGTADFVGMIATGSDHANITSSTLDTSKNVQRYWNINPYGSFALGTRDYDLQLTFLNPDDIRGGANTASFVIDQYYSSSWTEFAASATTSTSTTADNFTTMDGEFAVGEPDVGGGDVFYSIATGNWNDGNNWSYTGYGGAAALDFPDAANDIVFIGDGQSITLDQSRTIGSVTVEAVNSTGTLVFGNYVIDGNQFVVKDGGKLSLGSADGITTSGATGNVQSTIRNYNQNNHNNGNYVYTGSAANTGNGLPATIASLEINNTTTIDLTNAVEVTGDITITAGTLSSNNNNITLGSNWTNNGSFTAGSETLTLNGSTDQTIGGTSATTFNNVTINKDSADVLLQQNEQINGTLNFAKNALIVLNNNDLSIGESGTITGTLLGSSQMIQSDGSASAGNLIKKHATGSGVARNFVFPVGTGSDYNPAELNVTADFAAGAETDVQLRSGLHPNRVAGQSNMLSKFWSVATTGVSNIQQVANTSFKFTYLPGDVTGTQANYIPAFYSGGIWEVNLGTSRDATTSPVTVAEHTVLDGDWTAGEPGTIMEGRTYYSIASGGWDVPTNWSNISHSGAAASYVPGTFPYDTVFIDSNDEIDYDAASNGTVIQNLTIGLTSNGNLDYVRNSNKSLTLLGDLYVGTSGIINENGSGDRLDTLYVYGNIDNQATGGGTIDLRSGSTRRTTLIFAGGINSTVTGTGTWDLYNVNIEKTGGLADTVINQSTSFTNELTSAINGGQSVFGLTSGVYRHDNSATASLDDNGGADFTMGSNTGIEILQGIVTFNDDLITNTNTSIHIPGGRLNVGSGNNENFLYETGTTLVLDGGEMVVAACFSGFQSSSAIDLTISAGTLTVLDVYSNQYGDIYGFGLKANSSLTWSGGRLIYANPTNGGFDYYVAAETFSVTGGTLQFGIEGNLLSSGQRHSMNSSTPIYNLEIVESRYSTGHSSMILLDADNNILNDVIIRRYGTFDLNGNNVNIGGNFMNFGRFTPDGRGWNSGGPQRVTFNGSGDQYFFNENSYTNSTSGSSMNNEPFYEVVVDKTGGTFILDTAVQSSNSDLIVRNKLEFGSNNVAYIDGKTNSNRVEIDTRGGDLGEVNRYNLGHVDGILRMEVSTGNQNVLYHIGSGSDYTPATFDINGSGGSAGKIDGEAFGTDPSNISSNGVGLDLNRNVQRYWNFATNGGFALGGRNFDLTLQFLNPSDLRNGANWTLFQQFNATGTPYTGLAIGTLTDTTTQSTGNTNFGDIIVAELVGTLFYTRQDGNWNDPNTWSRAGYGGVAASTYPQITTDEAHIGDGNRVTLASFSPNIKTAVIEEYNGNYGELYMDAGVWIDGYSFLLNDSCTLATQHINGIRASAAQGSVRVTDTRVFGESHYIYNGIIDPQSIGDGLPGTIRSLTIDNSAAPGFSLVYLVQDQELTIEEDLYIKDGEFDAGPGTTNINIRGDMIADTGTEFYQNTRVINMDGTATQNITVNRTTPLDFYQLYINKPGARDSVIVNGTLTNETINITNRLRFADGNQSFMQPRPNHIIKMATGADLQRLGATPYGHVDGTLQKPMLAGADTALFEIGYGEDYAPVKLMLDNGSSGTAGPVNATNYEPVPQSPFYGNRMDTTVQIPRYWKVEAGDSLFTMGSRKANTYFSFPLVDMARIDTANAVIRRKSIPTETYEWVERRTPFLSWNVNNPWVELTASSNLWAGIGEFYIGEKAQRIFYSITDGDWDNNTTWAFDAAGTIPAPAGEYPNPDWNAAPGYEFEFRDSVIIDDSDIVTLNTLPELAYINITASGTLNINADRYIRESSMGSSFYQMSGNSTLNILSGQGIELEADTAKSIIRFADSDRFYDPTVNFAFSGSVPQTFGSGFPDTVNNVTLSNTGVGSNGIVALKPNDLRIDGNLLINSGELRPPDASSLLTLAGNLTVNGTFDATIDSSGAAVASTVYFAGSGASNQVVSGSGAIDFYNVNMNREAGAGTVRMDAYSTISNVLDLQEGANSNSQIIELGTGIDLLIENNSGAAIIDAGSASSPFRYIRTSLTSGSLIRQVTTGQTYTYPVGSLVSTVDHYTPSTFASGASGSDGTIAVRASIGTSTTFPRAHASLAPFRTTDYIERYWAIDNVTTTIPGQWRMDYVDADIPAAVTETNIDAIGKWRPVKEGSGGSWALVYGSITHPSNYFEGPAGMAASDFEGDWTIANLAAFRRIFYSRQTGNWNDDNTWTWSPTHGGAIFGSGQYPNGILDSAVIGGGVAGVGNHEVTLNIGPITTVGGVAVGLGNSDTGTLDFGTNVIAGQYFTLGDLSTIKIGSPDGITTLGNSTGNIQTTLSREFTDYVFTGTGGPTPVTVNGKFVYNGSADQAVGDALPASVQSLSIENTGLAGNNTVTLAQNTSIISDLSITSGRLDLQNFTANNSTASGAFTIASGAWLMLAGTNNLLLTINNFSSYAVDPASTVEFYGSDQTISSLPALLISGLGHVVLNSPGTKLVAVPLLIRGDLTIATNSTMQNNGGVDALSVYGNVINSATLENDGVIEIGN